MLDFKPLKLADKALADEYLNKCYIYSSELNFTTFYIWRKLLNVEFAVSSDCLIFKTQHNQNPFSLRFPLGGGDERNAVQECIDTFGAHTRFYGLTEDMVQKLNAMFPGEFAFSEMTESFDYVYTSEKLINLSGKRLHAKRNHINSFYKLYNCDFSPVTSADTQFITDAYENWYEDTGDEYLRQEKESITEILEHFEYLKLMGAKITVDGNLAAFTIGERLNPDTAVVHIEKADINYKGAYTVINQLFAQNYLSGFTYVNREEDMGLEGLRKAKQSYCPDLMIKKYKGVLK